MGTEQRVNGHGQAPLRNTRILVVEDETDDARFALEALEDLALEVDVEVTPYAERALELLGVRDFDCILLDYRLPRMDGTEFVRELRDRGRNVPVVVLTGRGSEDVADELFEAGVEAYIDKDNGDEDEIQASIEEAIEAAGPSASH